MGLRNWVMPGLSNAGAATDRATAYFPADPAEPHWRWHGAQVLGALDRATEPQIRQWLAPMVETFRLRFVTLHERLDAGERPTVSDHDWRAMFDLQEKIGRHLALDGNPVDGAINHTMRRFGQPPALGIVDRKPWLELLTPEQIATGVQPKDLAHRRRIGIWRWEPALGVWRSRAAGNSDPRPIEDVRGASYAMIDRQLVVLVRANDGQMYPHPDTPTALAELWYHQQETARLPGGGTIIVVCLLMLCLLGIALAVAFSSLSW